MQTNPMSGWMNLSVPPSASDVDLQPAVGTYKGFDANHPLSNSLRHLSESDLSAVPTADLEYRLQFESHPDTNEQIQHELNRRLNKGAK